MPLSALLPSRFIPPTLSLCLLHGCVMIKLCPLEWLYGTLCACCVSSRPTSPLHAVQAARSALTLYAHHIHSSTALSPWITREKWRGKQAKQTLTSWQLVSLQQFFSEIYYKTWYNLSHPGVFSFSVLCGSYVDTKTFTTSHMCAAVNTGSVREPGTQVLFKQVGQKWIVPNPDSLLKGHEWKVDLETWSHA